MSTQGVYGRTPSDRFHLEDEAPAGRTRFRCAESVLLQIGQDQASPFYRLRATWCFFIAKTYSRRGQQASNWRGARSTLRLRTDLATHNALVP